MQVVEAMADSLVKLVDYAGQYARRLSHDLDMRLKDDGSIVTNADEKVEAWLRTQLEKLAPGTKVWGEETGYSEAGDEGLWLVDPIDGTSNYSYGGPLWGVSVALYREGRIVMGAISLPDLDEIYLGIAGQGATLNGEPIKPIKPGPILDHEPVNFPDGLIFRYPDQKWPGKHRSLGSFVVDATFVATQRLRALISHKIRLYDAAAGICIAREVGATVRYADGTHFDERAHLDGKTIMKPFGFFPQDCNFKLKE